MQCCTRVFSWFTCWWAGSTASRGVPQGCLPHTVGSPRGRRQQRLPFVTTRRNVRQKLVRSILALLLTLGRRRRFRSQIRLPSFFERLGVHGFHSLPLKDGILCIVDPDLAVFAKPASEDGRVCFLDFNLVSLSMRAAEGGGGIEGQHA